MSDPIVIPPTQPGIKPPGANESERHASAQIIAKWLDELLHIPGTSIKIGLDPIIAFVPGVGEFLSSSVSAVVILESIRKGVAPTVIGRMGLNMLFNGIIGSVPWAGGLLAAMFKSNSRNLALLQEWQAGQQELVKKRSRRLVFIIGGLFIFIIVALLGLWIWWLWTVFSTVAKIF
jgi:Domain of unknown function (DUF4112)